MGNSSLLSMNNTDTVFTIVKVLLKDTPFKNEYVLFVSLAAVALVVIFLSVFLKTYLTFLIRNIMFISGINGHFYVYS